MLKWQQLSEQSMRVVIYSNLIVFFNMRFELIYFSSLFLTVFGEYERSPPGVPPRNLSQPMGSKAISGEKDQNAATETIAADIKFHDPSEFVKTKSINQEPPAHHHEHKSHGHGLGEEMDEEHLKQHNKKKYVDFSKMTAKERAMHHFKELDLDNDGKVDGLEMYKKFKLDETEHGEDFEESHIIGEIEHALEEFDKNNDGYCTYIEYKAVYKRLHNEI